MSCLVLSCLVPAREELNALNSLTQNCRKSQIVRLPTVSRLKREFLRVPSKIHNYGNYG